LGFSSSGMHISEFPRKEASLNGLYHESIFSPPSMVLVSGFLSFVKDPSQPLLPISFPPDSCSPTAHRLRSSPPGFSFCTSGLFFFFHRTPSFFFLLLRESLFSFISFPSPFPRTYYSSFLKGGGCFRSFWRTSQSPPFSFSPSFFLARAFEDESLRASPPT